LIFAGTDFVKVESVMRMAKGIQRMPIRYSRNVGTDRHETCDYLRDTTAGFP